MICSGDTHAQKEGKKGVPERDSVVKKPGSYADLHNSFLAISFCGFPVFPSQGQFWSSNTLETWCIFCAFLLLGSGSVFAGVHTARAYGEGDLSFASLPRYCLAFCFFSGGF
jgi:hypothetical protein